MNLPQPVYQEWLGELIDMVITARRNEFQVKRIEREAKALLSRNIEQPEIYWLILAFTAFLRGDRDDCVRCIQAAYALARQDVMILGNAASLLGHIGEPRLSGTYARQLASLSHDNARRAVNAARSLAVTLHLEEAAEIMRSLEAQFAIKDSDLYLRSVHTTLDLFQKSRIDFELRMALLESAIDTVRAEGCAPRYASPVRYPDGTLRYEIYVDEAANRCASVNFSIAETLTDRFENTHPEVITFVCRPFESFSPGDASIEVER